MTEPATPAAAPQTSAPPTDTDDSIIGDILKADPKEPSGDTDGGDDGDAPEAEAQADDDHESEDTTDADAEPADDAEPDDAAEPDEPDAATLKAARKAADDGDLDKAFMLAFGKKPEQLYPNDKTWTKWRAANNKRDQAFQQREQGIVQREHQVQVNDHQNRQQLQAVIEQLKPYEKLHQQKMAFKQTGDPEYLKQMLEEAAEMPYDDAQKMILTKTRRSPGERALQQQVQTLMQKLEEKERKQAEEAQQQTTQQQYANDIGIITSTLKGEVTKVPKFAERVYQVLVKTRTPTGLSMTIEEAGRRVLHAERQRIAKHPLVSKPPPKPEVSEAARKLAQSKTRKPPPVLRRDSRSNGAVDEKQESTDDILNEILPKKARLR